MKFSKFHPREKTTFARSDSGRKKGYRKPRFGIGSFSGGRGAGHPPEVPAGSARADGCAGAHAGDPSPSGPPMRREERR